MPAAQTRVDNAQLAIRDVVRFNFGLFLAQGITMTLLGVAAVIWPQVLSLVIEVYVGWIFLFSGMVGLLMMLFAPNAAGFLWSLLTGGLTMFVGVLLLWHPVEGIVSLMLVLVAFFLVEGVFQIAMAMAYRPAFPDAWRWMLLSGVADLILAVLIIAGWPGSAGWALGIIVGMNLITSGLALVMAAIASRRAIEEVIG
jgi:uncharacterized membrane protein HdeD (DUF308 family)